MPERPAPGGVIGFLSYPIPDLGPVAEAERYHSPRDRIFGETITLQSPLMFDAPSRDIVRSGTQAFLIHRFMWHQDHDEKKQTPYTRAYVLREGIRDYLSFLEQLRDSDAFAQIDAVIGQTNARMANFAINRLGFHRTDYPNPLYNVFDRAVHKRRFIGAHREELIESIPHVQEFQARISR